MKYRFEEDCVIPFEARPYFYKEDFMIFSELEKFYLQYETTNEMHHGYLGT